MKDIPTRRGAKLLRQMVAEGEHETQDFKFAISDARKIARSISAFANNKGGRLLIGVKDNGVIAGVRNEEDIYVVEQAAERYCRPAQNVEFEAYKVEEATVIVAKIATALNRPVCVAEEKGELKAYYRVADQNIAAHPLMTRVWEYMSDSFSEPLGARHYEVAAAFQDDIRLDRRQVALKLHLEQSRADDIIARLIAADILTFAFDGKSFVFMQKKS